MAAAGGAGAAAGARAAMGRPERDALWPLALLFLLLRLQHLTAAEPLRGGQGAEAGPGAALGLLCQQSAVSGPGRVEPGPGRGARVG